MIVVPKVWNAFGGGALHARRDRVLDLIVIVVIPQIVHRLGALRALLRRRVVVRGMYRFVAHLTTITVIQLTTAGYFARLVVRVGGYFALSKLLRKLRLLLYRALVVDQIFEQIFEVILGHLVYPLDVLLFHLQSQVWEMVIKKAMISSMINGGNKYPNEYSDVRHTQTQE